MAEEIKKEEQTNDLENHFLKIEKENKEEIEKLKQELAKRDELIKKYMTLPSTKKTEMLSDEDEDEDENKVTEQDVKKVLDIINSKRR